MSDLSAPLIPKRKRTLSSAEIGDRLVKAGVKDPDFLTIFINEVVALGEQGKGSDDRQINFLVSAIEEIVGNQSNGGAAKAMLAAQFTAVHVAIMEMSRRFSNTTTADNQEIIGRLLNNLMRTSVAQYEALNRNYTGVATVGHVSVNQGGQAIVGSVTHNQHEPAMQKSASPQPLLSDANAAPMPIIEGSDKRVPIPVSRKKGARR